MRALILHWPQSAITPLRSFQLQIAAIEDDTNLDSVMYEISANSILLFQHVMVVYTSIEEIRSDLQIK